MSALMIKELELLERFRDMNLNVELMPNSVRINKIVVTSDLQDRIKKAQETDLYIQNKKGQIERGEIPDINKGTDGVYRYRNRIYVPNDRIIKNLILEESHKSKLSIHPGATKMYQDLKKIFWWPRMKREIAQYVNSCLTCQKAKDRTSKASWNATFVRCASLEMG